jgi:uncharacterized membrane protein
MVRSTMLNGRILRKYIKDFSLIKEYPPESVKVWNKYLVYATALGIADEVENPWNVCTC